VAKRSKKGEIKTKILRESGSVSKVQKTPANGGMLIEEIPTAKVEHFPHKGCRGNSKDRKSDEKWKSRQKGGSR